KGFTSIVPTIQPGADYAFQLPGGINPASISVPPEAIELTYEQPRYYVDFYSLHGEELAEEVTIENEIEAANRAHPRNLLNYIELKVTYETGDPGYKQVWIIKLAASGLLGARQSRWFLRPKQVNPSITIEGKAFYSDNSIENIQQRTFNTPIIHVTGDLLNI